MNNSEGAANAPNNITTTVDELNSGQLYFLISLNIVELLIALLLTCPVSMLNFVLIFKTSILHPNFKFILLCQSACFMIRAIGRFVLFVERWSTGDYGALGSRLLILFYYSPVFFRNFLVHVIVVERGLATLFVRTYEQKWTKPYLSITWFSIALLVSILNAAILSQLISIITSATMVILGIIEIFLLALLHHFNGRVYASSWSFFHVHSLSHKYQLVENIRTAKQLIPVFILYLMEISITSSCQAIGLFGLCKNTYCSILGLQICFTAAGFVGFLIEIAMIICHPFLKRNLIRFIYIANNNLVMLKNGKVGPTSEDSHKSAEEEPYNPALKMVNIRGEQLQYSVADASNRHFEELEQSWMVAAGRTEATAESRI